MTMTNQMMAYNGDGIEKGYLTLAQAEAQYGAENVRVCAKTRTLDIDDEGTAFAGWEADEDES